MSYIQFGIKKPLDICAKHVYVYAGMINEKRYESDCVQWEFMKFSVLPISALGLSLAVLASGSSVVSAEQIDVYKSIENKDINDKSERVTLALAGEGFERRWAAGGGGAAVENRIYSLARIDPDAYSDSDYQNRDSLNRTHMNATELYITKMGTNDKGSNTPSDAARGDVPECGSLSMKRSEVRELVESAAERHGVDKGFAAAIAWAESDFGRELNSPAGARGTMQLMPETARGLGVEDICDPVSNIDGGVRHLRRLLEVFPNPLLAAAAYNAGEAAVLQHGGIPPFQETVRYVAKVVNYQLGLVPEGPRLVEQASVSGLLNRSAPPDVGEADQLTFIDGVMNF